MPDHDRRRVLLKISGEALSGEGAAGVHPGPLEAVARAIADAAAGAAQIAIVVGGGNIVRGGALAAHALVPRFQADVMGMLGTAVNAVALAEALSAAGAPAVPLSAVSVPDYIGRYHPAAAAAHLDAGRIVVLGGGVGNPYFTTDTTGVLRAVELGCDEVLKATKVDGVYDRDPKRHADAVRFETLTAQQAVDQRLGVMDLTAMTMAIEHAMPIVVFDFAAPGAVATAVAGGPIGTRVTPS